MLMKVMEAEERATSFAKSFAQTLSQLVSDFPKEYWGFFPPFMTRPFRIIAIVASNGIALRYVRPSSKLRVVGSTIKGRLEGTIFPIASADNMFLLENVHDSSISHLRLANRTFADAHTLPAGTNLVCPPDWGVAEIRGDVQFAFEDVQFAWRIGRRDVVLYEHLLFIFSPPATNLIDSTFGAKQAESHFGDFLSWSIFDPSNPKSSQLDYAGFLLKAARMLEKQFGDLIQRSDVEEAELQEFLCEHKSILTSKLGYRLAQCKVRLSANDIADFVLTSGSQLERSAAIEIEPSHYEVITAAGSESPRLRGAMEQLRRYMKAMRDKDTTGKSEIRGVAIIGRSSTMDQTRREQLGKQNEALSEENITTITFDELLENLRSRREVLEKNERDLSAGNR